MVDEVTKYELYLTEYGEAELRAHPCGDWVCYEAYAELLEKFNELTDYVNDLHDTGSIR